MKKIYKPKKDKAYTFCETVQAITAVIIGAVLICMIAYLIKMPTKAKAVEKTTETPKETTSIYYEEAKEDRSKYKKYIDIVPLEPVIIKHVVEKAEEKGIDPALVFAVIEVESNFKTEAKNESCIGLMQVNCENYDNPNLAMASLISPTLNIDAGIEILSGHLKKYPVEKALTCYNLGENGAKNKTSSCYANKVLQAKEKYE